MYGISNNPKHGGRNDSFHAIPSPAIEGMAVHALTCSIWETPADSAPEALIVAGIDSEVTAQYLARVRPLYDAAKRCIGQLSGILLLLQTSSLDRARDGLLLASVTQQIREASDRLAAITAPRSASLHYTLLNELIVRVGRIRVRLDQLREMLDPASPDLDQVVEELFAAQSILHRVSRPEAGLAPVDFAAACCNCANHPKHKSLRRS